MIEKDWNELNKDNLRGSLFLLPTDTVYGLHALVGDEDGLSKLKKAKNREDSNLFIILISDISEIKNFDIKLTAGQKELLSKIWPGRYTVIFTDRNGETKSFRFPDKLELRNLIERVGPIYSSSANLPGETCIYEVSDLPEFLEKEIDIAVDEGKVEAEASTIIKVLR